LGGDNSAASKFGGHPFAGAYPDNTGFDVLKNALGTFNADGNIDLGNASGSLPINYYERETNTYTFTATMGRDAAHPYSCVKKIDPRLNAAFLYLGIATNWTGLRAPTRCLRTTGSSRR